MECLAIRPLAVVSSNGPTPVTLATVDAAEAALEVVDEAQGHLEAAVVTLEWTRSITGLLLALSVERGPLKVVTFIPCQSCDWQHNFTSAANLRILDASVAGWDTGECFKHLLTYKTAV